MAYKIIPSEPIPTMEPITATPVMNGIRNQITGNFSGNGKISGFAAIKSVNTSDITVILYDESSSQYVSETITDSTGRFEFSGLNENITYYVTMKEPSNGWEYRVQSRILPVVE